MSYNQRIYYSPLCQNHQVSSGHPERPERLQALVNFLQAENRCINWQWSEPPRVEKAWFEWGHPKTYVEQMFALVPAENEPLLYLDGDTCWSSQSGVAISLAGGALQHAVDNALEYSANHAATELPISFCLNRPPGHHAEKTLAMGFCVFSLIACAAIYAQQHHGVERVAVLDFDVHHGNGTEDVLESYPQIFFASSYEENIFPAGTKAQNTAYRKCLPMPSQISSSPFRTLWEEDVFSALMDYQPQLILVSAGFDAHRNDPLANCDLVEDDFSFLAKRIKAIALEFQAPIIANLEGGYDLDALAKSAYAFIHGLEGE